ncbi:MAG: hypothetical protein ACTHLE_22460 [Agriterribacter sp.]
MIFEFQIDEFWEWFKQHSHKLSLYDEFALRELDQKMLGWELGWEIGPGFKETNSFTISPCGNISLLEKAKRILDRAPELSMWEFFSWKQPKENWFILKLPDVPFEIDASDWTYILLRYPDDKFEILLKADNIIELSQFHRELIPDLIITNLLGEKKKIEMIDLVNIVAEFETPEMESKLKYLPEHLQQLRKSNKTA